MRPFGLRNSLRIALRALVGLLWLGTSATHVSAQVLGGPEPPEVDWTVKLGAQVPLDARFADHEGREVRFGELLGERPVILALVYYECPMLCDMVLNGLVRCLRAVALDVGRDFDVIAISVDPHETHELASAKRAAYAEEYGRAGALDGFRFLVGSEASIAAVSEAVGFEFVYVPEIDEYAHAAGITVLTPAGRVANYFYGVEFAPRDVRLGLVDAGGGAIGSVVDKFILRCFHYDPTKGRYGFAIMTTIRVLGLLTVAAIAVLIARAVLRDQRLSRLASSTHSAG